jgi:hypothetical protein
MQAETMIRDADAAKARGTLVTGVFPDRTTAEHAYASVTKDGYTKDDVDVIMSDDTRTKYFGKDAPDSELGTKAAEGAGVGGAIGGTIGAILGAVVATGTALAIPGLGLVIAGPLAAAIAGAGAGSITGGLVGALVGYGIPEDRVKLVESGIRDGGIYMGVRARDQADATRITNTWAQHKPLHAGAY